MKTRPHLLQAGDGVRVSLHQAGGGLGLRLCRAGDLEKTPRMPRETFNADVPTEPRVSGQVEETII